MSVCVVGLGRVGLPAAVALSSVHDRVLGVDVDERCLAAIAGGARRAEPGLAEAAQRALAEGRLALSTQPKESDVYLICVPTPLDDHRSADLRALQHAVAGLPLHGKTSSLLLIGSTVPVGTTERVAAEVRRRAPDVRVACSPERILPGRALTELREIPRLVGGVDHASTQAAVAVWAGVAQEVVPTTARAAELAKLVENASRDVQLALANSVAGLADHFGIARHELWDLVQRHPRVSLLEPGIGVGGHCLPVDPWFLVQAAPGPGALFAVARDLNDAVPARIVDRLAAELPAGATVAQLGLAYKPDVDDARNAPAIALARGLRARGVDLVVHDPWVTVVDLPQVPLEAALQREVVVVAVAHACYRGVSLQDAQVGIDLCHAWR